MTNENTVKVHRLLNLMKGLYRSLEREWDEYAGQYGITNAHLHVLWILSMEDGIKLSDLAEKGVWNLSTTHDIVTRMVHKGLIKKQKDMEDGRVTRVYITEEGLNLRDKTKNDFDGGHSFKVLKAVENLDENDRDKFYELLGNVAHQVLNENFMNYIESSSSMISEEK